MQLMAVTLNSPRGVHTLAAKILLYNFLFLF